MSTDAPKETSKKSKPSSKQSTENTDVPLPVKRGRKIKYNTDEERIAARRQQQREYRARKKQEMEDLRNFKQQMTPKSSDAKPKASDSKASESKPKGSKSKA